MDVSVLSQILVRSAVPQILVRSVVLWSLRFACVPQTERQSYLEVFEVTTINQRNNALNENGQKEQYKTLHRI